MRWRDSNGGSRHGYFLRVNRKGNAVIKTLNGRQKTMPLEAVLPVNDGRMQAIRAERAKKETSN